MIFIWLNNSEDFEFKYVFIGFLVQKSMFYSVFSTGVGVYLHVFSIQSKLFLREKSRKKIQI